MKKNWLLISITIILYVGIIILSSYYIIKPGINKIKEANQIKELTYDEKTTIIDQINEKYIDLDKQTNDKYTPMIEEINTSYQDSSKEINDKYSALETKIEAKYKDKTSDLKNRINDLSVASNKEFFANGLSKKYYTLRDQISELEEQKRSIGKDKTTEIEQNDKLKNAEMQVITDKKDTELLEINNNKTKELQRLKDKKNLELEEINNRNIDKSEITNLGIIKIIIGIVIILIPLFYLILMFNRLTHLLNSLKEKWSQVDVYLKQRSDLIPNILESVKGYSKHEKDTFEKVTKARNAVLKADTKEAEIEANKKLGTAINKFFLLQEAYPDLKADQNFMNLQYNLKEIENNISISRQNYNKSVLKYKNRIDMFPSNIVANIFNFKPEMFFEIDENEKDNPKIKFE